MEYTRPTNLDEFDIRQVTFEHGGLFVTMSQGQWDGLLSAAYDRGHTLLELDDDEMPVAAYRRAESHGAAAQR